MPTEYHPPAWYLGRLDLLIKLLPLADDFRSAEIWQQVLADEVIRSISALKENAVQEPYPQQQTTYTAEYGKTGGTFTSPAIITAVIGPAPNSPGNFLVNCVTVFSESLGVINENAVVVLSNKLYVTATGTIQGQPGTQPGG
jgi:hypothetical protein